MNEQESKFQELLKKFHEEVRRIDSNTGWQENAPKWWLDMMEVDRIVLSKMNGTEKQKSNKQ